VYVYIYIYIYVYIYIRIYICICIYIYISIYIHTHTHTHSHTYIYRERKIEFDRPYTQVVEEGAALAAVEAATARRVALDTISRLEIELFILSTCCGDAETRGFACSTV